MSGVHFVDLVWSVLYLVVSMFALMTDILKQQGHFFDMNCLAYSPDGQYIATGGEDAKLKIWNAESGICFVTFHGILSNVFVCCISIYIYI
jgi:WD40 repeat protein